LALSEALRGLNATQGQDPAARFATLIVERDLAALMSAVADRQQSHGDAVALFREAIVEFLRRGIAEPLIWLARCMPADTVLAFYTHYAMASVAAWNGDVDETSRRLRDAVRIAIAGQAVLATDPAFRRYLTVVAQQALYLDHALPLHSAPIRASAGVAPSPSARALTVLASCNDRYFDRFGANFIASGRKFLPDAAIHIHVSNPSEESRRLMAAPAVGGAVTFSCEETPDEACIFACKRFLLAPEVMRARQSDLLISDIDVEFTDDTISLAGFMAGHDGGLFERRNVSPMEICHCSLAYFRHTANAQRFLSVLAGYIEAKLATDDLRLWMLDQCALFVVSRRAMRNEPPALWGEERRFSWVNLADIAGMDLADFQTNQTVAAGAKAELRDWTRRHFDALEQRPDGSVHVR
jgi:hypothetical protein